MDRTLLRLVGNDWSSHDCSILLPASSSEQPRPYQKRNNCTGRLDRWTSQYRWHAAVHDGSTGNDQSGSEGTKLIHQQWGGYQYDWVSAHVLAPLILGGIMLLVLFPLWEVFGAKHPMFPSRLKKEPRIMALTLVITFISGSNFFSVLLFWPTQAFNVYGHDPVQVGIRGIPIGFSILAGACVVLWLLSVFRGQNKMLMIISSIMMTAGMHISRDWIWVLELTSYRNWCNVSCKG